MLPPYRAAMDVVLVPWPREQARRHLLMEAGAPRLLLVEPGHAPPDSQDCMEDWVRVPAPDEDLKARVAGLAARHRSHSCEVPEVDDDGVLRLGARWVALPPVEARLTAALLERFGAVVSRGALAGAGWPQGPPRRNALDVHVVRMRRRLASVGLSIRTVRSRGYLLEASEPSPSPSPPLTPAPYRA